MESFLEGRGKIQTWDPPETFDFHDSDAELGIQVGNYYVTR